MKSIEELKEITKSIKQNDVCITYLKRSIAHSKDWVNVVAGFGVLNEHMKEVYNIELV